MPAPLRGLRGYFTEIVDRTRRQLEALKTDQLVCYCGSCSNNLGNIWPRDHGVKLPFPVISLYEWPEQIALFRHLICADRAKDAVAFKTEIHLIHGLSCRVGGRLQKIICPLWAVCRFSSQAHRHPVPSPAWRFHKAGRWYSPAPESSDRPR